MSTPPIKSQPKTAYQKARRECEVAFDAWDEEYKKHFRIRSQEGYVTAFSMAAVKLLLTGLDEWLAESSKARRSATWLSVAMVVATVAIMAAAVVSAVGTFHSAYHPPAAPVVNIAVPPAPAPIIQPVPVTFPADAPVAHRPRK
jgi:hypothetical protein